MKYLALAALYLAFGFVLYVIFESPFLDPANGWTYVWILAWPIPVALFLGKWMLIFTGGVAALCVLFLAWLYWTER